MLYCPADDITCPYITKYGTCTLENAKENCDEFYGLDEESEEE